MKKQLAKIFLLIFLISFVLNLIWEYVHSSFLYYSHNFPMYFMNNYLFMIFYVSFVDGLLITLMYFITAIIFRNLFWIKNPDKKKLIVFSIIGIVISFLIEIRALMTNRWQYSELMPTIFGIGLSPLIQLAVTGVVTIYIVNKFGKRNI